MPPRRQLIALVALPWSWFLVRDLASVMEVVAVGLPLLGVASVLGSVAGLISKVARRALPFTLSTILMVTTAVVLPRIPDPGPTPVDRTMRMASANLTGENRLAGEGVMALARSGADVLVLLEANPHALDAVGALAAEYPFVESGTLLGFSRVMVVSRFPLEQVELPAELETGRIVAVEVSAPEPFTLFAAHLPRPWRTTSDTQATPAEQQRLITSLTDHVAGVDGPLVLAGDLNATDRGMGYRTLTASLTDVIRTDWASTTSSKWWPLLLRIDHVLARGLCASAANAVPLPGSDHRGLSVTLGAC